MLKKLLALILILMMVFPVQAFAYMPTEEPAERAAGFNSVFEIEIKKEDSWIKAGSLGFGKFSEIKEIDLGEYLNGTNALIRISQNGGGASYLDAVFLDGAQAVKANGAEGKVLNKLSKEDLDITPVEDGIILEFPANEGKGILSLTGRIENEVIGSQPLQFPAENNFKFKEEIKDFYTYTLESNIGTLKIDGVLDEVENLEPFIKDYRVPDSGHPAGDLYFWVMNDTEYLYVTMDITPDNTYDGDKDYAKVYVNTDEGIKEFKVSVPETKWGNTAFTYTDKVAYEHKVYEFVIPLSEICSKNNEQIDIAFVAYGTMSYNDNCFNPALAYDSENKVYLCVFEYLYEYDGDSSRVIAGEFVDKDGNPMGYKFGLVFGNSTENGDVNLSNPSVVFNPAREEFMITWVENNENIDYVCAMGIKYNSSWAYDITIAPFIISSNTTDTNCKITTPKISYDSDNNEYLIVWSEYIVNYIIQGQFLNADGTLKGSKFKISTVGGESYPSLSYSESWEAFLVAWENSSNIEARGVKSLENNSVRFSSVSNLGVGNKPNVSFNYSSDRLFVTWEYNGIFGQYFDFENIDLNLKSVSDKLAIQVPHDGYNVGYPSAYYDGSRNMLTVWDLFKAEGDCYAELRYIDIYADPDGLPFYTDGDLEYRDKIDVSRMPIAISGDNEMQNIIAYVVDDGKNIGYKVFGDYAPPEPPAYIEEEQPDLAYHSELDIYLSVFTGYNLNTGESYIYGQLVDNEGEKIGERFLINDGTDNDDPEDDGCLHLPSVAVDEHNNFLVAWSQSISYEKIYASKVTIEKISENVYDAVIGDAFKVSENTDFSGDGNWCYYYEYDSDIAYNCYDDNFLVVWEQRINDTGDLSDTGSDIYGSIVDIEGNIIESTFEIINTQYDESYPSVSYSAADNKYLVAWQRGDWLDPWFVEATVIDDNNIVYKEVVIADDSMSPNVSYNDKDNKFLITWSNNVQDYDSIKGAYYNILDNKPNRAKDPFVITELDSYYVYPAAYFDGADRMLCVWNPVDDSYGPDSLNISNYGDSSMYAKLRYIGNEGPVGKMFNTVNPEAVALEEPIAITGNLKGQFLIAYEVDNGYIEPYGIQALDEYDPECSTIGYRLIGELRIDPYLEFVNDPYRVQVGNTIQAEVNYFDGENNNDVTDNVTYVSLNPEIATVSTSGAIKGEALGHTYIEAYYSTYINDVKTTISAIAARVDVYKKSSPGPAPQKTIIGQVIVDGKVLKDIYAEDLVADGGIYSFEAAKTGDNAKLWLLATYYKQIANKNPNGTLQLTWDAASYNLPLKSGEVLKEVNNIGGSKVNIILEKVDDEELIESASAAVDKLGGKMVSGLVDFSVTVEGKSKEVNIDRYNLYVERTINQLNKLDAYSTTAMKLLENDEFTFAPSVFGNKATTIKYRGNGIFAVINNPKSFSDIKGHWSKMNVEKLAARNIAFGKSDGIFAPNDYITRAEFAVMITRALAIVEEEGTMNFEDVQGWYEEDIATAYDAGLINGRGDGKFYPNEKILRKDMAVMIQNALKFVGKDVSVKDIEGILSMFADSSAIDKYAKESVALCTEAGIILGRDTKEFDPDENATRAEASAIIERMLRHIEFIN